MGGLHLGSYIIKATGEERVFNLIGGKIMHQGLFDKEWSDTKLTAESVPKGKEKAQEWASEN